MAGFDLFIPTKLNPIGSLYLIGDENTDGSLRVLPDTAHNGKHFQFEYRTNGVWNTTSLDLDGASNLNFGQGVSIGAGGNHLRTSNEAKGQNQLYAHRHYSDIYGSTEAHDDPVLGPLNVRVISQPDNSGEMFGNTLNWTLQGAPGFESMATKVYLQVSSAATDNATYTVRQDDANGGLLFRTRVSAADLSVGETGIDIPGWQETVGLEVFYVELEVDNGGTIGIASNVSETSPWLAADFYTHTHEHLAPMEFTVDAMIIDSLTHEIVLDTNGNMIAATPNYGENY